MPTIASRSIACCPPRSVCQRLHASGGFHGDSGLSTWLSRIAMNEALARLRRGRPTSDLDAVEGGRIEAQIIQFPQTTVGRSGANNGTTGDLAAGRARNRQSVSKSFVPVFERMRVERTAALLNLQPKTVSTRLYHAVSLAREQLEQKIEPILTGACRATLRARCERSVAAVRLPCVISGNLLSPRASNRCAQHSTPLQSRVHRKKVLQ
jgi:RNA polymerase sigma-70 factor, ECF subfamily